MRPRVFPAEDAVALARLRSCGGASMRPRVFPAEDTMAPLRRLNQVSLQ